MPNTRPKVAAIFTVMRFRSHAYDILENFRDPYLFNGELVDPGVDVVSFYADQRAPEGDMLDEARAKFDVPLYDTIAGALCCGGDKLAVDAVLVIGEHGEYPYNPRLQHMYPRKRFFDEVVAVMKQSGRAVPYFSDKHFSYRWDWISEMVATARELNMPMMGGSSVPLAQRVPATEVPADAEFDEAVVIHAGGLESYDFHGLEILQSLVEGRKGGEAGVSRIQVVQGKDLRSAIESGRISQQLIDAAMKAELGETVDIFRPVDGDRSGELSPAAEPYALLLDYADGLKASVLRVGANANRWNAAFQLKGETEPQAFRYFNGPWGNRNLFKALSHAIQHLFVTGEEPYPTARTVLTSGILTASMESYIQGGVTIATPFLETPYLPKDFKVFREMGESWKVLTKETPEPKDFRPGFDVSLVKG
ncbi:MAG: hypothetical protein O2955_16045 [Planctomycetota bacterium]|nr:hypothetical protein [Planctomycetota bacterium]MDA1214027.1 hypothetical protein [Planctomycetota bacterium]